jgi:RES domain-containing protein
MVIDASSVPLAKIEWKRAVRIIRSLYPLIDLFEDIADPADWALILSAEQKTNPRLMETIGNLDLIPLERRVSGPGASYLMAPFTHVSPDRPSRFSDGSFGVLYVGKVSEVALFETMHHHARFMTATAQRPGWTSQFREIVLDVDAELHDVRNVADNSSVLAPSDHTEGQALGLHLRGLGSEGIVYPSVRAPGGECVGLFYPNRASLPTQGRHLDYHWNGTAVDFYRDAGSGQIYRVVVEPSSCGQP